jgi:hypothetical protein
MHQLRCLGTATVLEECRFVTSAAPSALEASYEPLEGTDPGVRFLDLDRVVCPFLPICDPVVNREVVRRDRTHLAERFAQSLAPAIGDYLTSSGLIE